MIASRMRLEQQFFRALNSVVEPLVRSGTLSSKRLPTTLLVLESTGFKSGKTRSTPLFGQQLGSYLLLSTARGNRSFWVRNLQKQPQVSYYIGGEEHRGEALVIAADSDTPLDDLPLPLWALGKVMQALAARGWAFALLQR